MVGVGSRQGDDVAGLRVAEALAAGGLPEEVAVHRCEHPEIDLLPILEASDVLVLVDATRSGRPPGTVHCPSAADLPASRPLSTHGLGVAGILALAHARGRMPAEIALVGIEAGEGVRDDPCPEVRAAVAEACTVVEACVARWRAGGRLAAQEGPDGGASEGRSCTLSP